MNELLKMFGLVHLFKMFPDTAQSLLDGAFKIFVVFFSVWLIVIITIVYFALKIFNVAE
jgi:hypothetical protein